MELGSNWETRGWVARECAQIPPQGGRVGTILGTHWIPEDLTPPLSFTGKYLAKPKAYSYSGDFRFKRPPFLKNPFNSSLCKFSRGCRVHGFPTDPGKPETKTLQKRCLGVFAETSYCPEWKWSSPFLCQLILKWTSSPGSLPSWDDATTPGGLPQMSLLGEAPPCPPVSPAPGHTNLPAEHTCTSDRLFTHRVTLLPHL